MLYHNLKLAIRNLQRHTSFSFINILGLTIGIASCVIIGLYIFNELSFDKFHKQHGNIYRVNKVTNEKGGKAQLDGITPGQLAPAAVKDIPEVVAATRFRPWFNEMLVTHDTIRLKLDDVLYADASFLQVFDFPLLKGERKNVLKEPYSAVITESTAKKYFKDADPMGKTLVTLNDIPVKVTGIAKDVAANSSIQFTMLISWETIASPAAKDYFSWMDNWITQVDYTFLQLKEDADPLKTGNEISAMMHRYKEEKEFQFRPYLQRLDDIHLHSSGISYSESFRTNSNKIIYTLSIISIFILLIACFNFINLTTAGALGRAKETGVQKVLGAKQSQLIGKFFSESFMLCLFSLIAAIMLVSILLPLFNRLAETSLTIAILFKPKLTLALTGLLVLISIIAGLYPAIFLSRFKSTDVFRNIIKAGKDNWLRKSLVTTQFALSILLIIATIVVNRQMQYMTSRDLGFQRDQVVVVPLANTGMESKAKEFTTALKNFRGIESVSMSNRVPGQSLNGYGIIPEGRRQEEHLLSSVLETDADFASTYNTKMIAGRFFSPQFITDTADAIVINEAMVRYLNWTDPIGKQFEIHEARKGKIIGVVKDFNFASLRESVQPLAIILNNNPLYLSVKLKGGTIQSSLADIRKEWKQLNDQYPFDYFFMDQQLNRFYKTDVKLMQILGIFAILAIVIACMGLFGLSIYTARQRTKEIGIRKVLGASVSGITVLLSKEFLKLVVIASIISFPLAWWAMNNWLQDFAYRIHIGAGVFAIAAIAAIVVALLTVSLQAIKAAVANPVKSLRTD
ncbi:MAG: ABC transporter permease [Chitinophagaceae bacterium]